MLYLCYLCRFKPLRDHLRGFLIAAWAGDKIAEFSFPEISFHFPLRPWFFFVSPAYAGKRRTIPRRRSAAPDHPRVCGEKLYPICSSIDLWGSPPRMRGKRSAKPLHSYNSWDHPRVCGEKGDGSSAAAAEPGSPPRMRGKEFLHPLACVIAGITPACAGKRKTAWKGEGKKQDHPRMCGEKQIKGFKHDGHMGSPPHVRGKD